MEIKKIMVPYDGSESALNAMEYALYLREALNATVDVVSVVPPKGIEAGVGELAAYENALNDLAAGTEELLKEHLVTAFDTDILQKVNAQAVVDKATVEGIRRYVGENDVDLVIMGRRGVGALRAVLGSVSTAVLRELDIPVLTVK
ncbi:MAG: universal stress protein [Coriobacteriia bacterium]|nr:universal stress protein [Coriobacteriia bacterium]